MSGGLFGWLVSYPKSGNTWLRLMLSSLISQGRPVDINAPAIAAGIVTYAEMDELLGVDSSELTPGEIADARPALHGVLAASSDVSPVLRKLHDRYWRTSGGQSPFRPDLSLGAVYLLRDPRDIAVSYAHHRGCAIDEVIAFMADESAALAIAERGMKEQLPQPLGSWSGHVLSWLDQGEIPVLAIRYEDLRADPVRHLAAIAAHLSIACEDHAIEGAVAATRFEILRAQEDARGFVERRPGATAPFFREGRAGGWRERLTRDQADRIVALHGPVMARFGYLPSGS